MWTRTEPDRRKTRILFWRDAKEPKKDPNIDETKCYLLSLPKELRLEIWKYVVTDPSVTELVLGIGRKAHPMDFRGRHYGQPLLTTNPSEIRRSIPYPELRTSFVKPRNVPINVQLLRTNRFIYEEALPVLYHSVKFAPLDLEGVFPLFLGRLSSFACSHIRYIKLYIPQNLQGTTGPGDSSKTYFHWPITCAQIAQLSDTLRQIEVEGHLPEPEKKKLRRLLLYPLCKIRVPKKLVPENDEIFQQQLAEAEKEREAKVGVRKMHTDAEAAERTKRDAECKKRRLPEAREEAQKQEIYNFTSADLNPFPTAQYSPISDSNIAQDLNKVSGIDQFERELEKLAGSPADEEKDHIEGNDPLVDWDVVSVHSATSTLQLRPESFHTKQSEDSWSDTASTILPKSKNSKEQSKDQDGDSDSGSDSWEIVEKQV